jgi:hypothetical protein
MRARSPQRATLLSRHRLEGCREEDRLVRLQVVNNDRITVEIWERSASRWEESNRDGPRGPAEDGLELGGDEGLLDRKVDELRPRHVRLR